MKLMRRSNTIYLNSSLTLALGLFCFTLLSMLLVFHFILSPMANRAADDLGALMHILSQSWFSLSEDSKKEFQTQLRNQHLLFITEEEVSVTEIKKVYPYIPRLEQALRHHTGQLVSVKQSIDDELCFWVDIPQDGQSVKIGFLHERIGPHPAIALVGIFAIGCVLIFVTSVILARRIIRPITTLSEAVNQLGAGKLSTRIDETGPEELVLLSRNFNMMAQQISQLLSNRSILFGGVSHDLRTPITRMQIALELLEDEENVTLISGMRNDLEEMESLIQQSLELVKGMDEQPAIDMEINKVIEEIVLDYHRQYKIIQWQKSGCGICKLQLNAFRRVMSNLLDNAFDYGDNKPVSLSCLKQTNKLIISISDQGSGIPEDKIETVFQPFYRLDNSRNRKTGGSGLGLTIVKQLCDIHGWKIQLIPHQKQGLEAKLEITVE